MESFPGFVADVLTVSAALSEGMLSKVGAIASAALVPAICLMNFRRVSGFPEINSSSRWPHPESEGASGSSPIINKSRERAKEFGKFQGFICSRNGMRHRE